ncbi:MAG: lipopolysaccharide biosynthesis regulator YciM [Lentisphaeria bacterium]
MADLGVFGIIGLALGIGFCVGLYGQRLFTRKQTLMAGTGGIAALTHLIDGKPDAAIDAFVSALEVNAETLDTHLAFGNLLGKRGEVVQSVKVHQNILERRDPSEGQRQIVRLELAKDYVHSGLLDRAESLLKELAETKNMESPLRARVLKYLPEVYQELHEWLPAIDVADRLTTRKFGVEPDRWREA